MDACICAKGGHVHRQPSSRESLSRASVRHGIAEMGQSARQTEVTRQGMYMCDTS